jgi:hypothetical protein
VSLKAITKSERAITVSTDFVYLSMIIFVAPKG